MSTTKIRLKKERKKKRRHPCEKDDEPEVREPKSLLGEGGKSVPYAKEMRRRTSRDPEGES